MKRLILALPLIIGLSGCQSVTGVLTTEAPLKLSLEKGKSTTLTPGSYETKLESVDKGTKLKIEVKDSKGKKRTVKLIAPDGSALPTESGSFELRGADSNQEFDLRGVLNTDLSVAGPFRGIESCSRNYSEVRCYGYPYGYPYGRHYDPYLDQMYYDHGLNAYRYRGRMYYRGCQTYDIHRQGYREVTFRERTRTMNVSVEFLDSKTGQVIGKFNGKRRNTDREYEYAGICH